MAMDTIPDDQTVYHMVQSWYGEWSKSIGNGNGNGNNIKKIFKPPTLKEVQDYIDQNNYQVDPEDFINFYTSKDWMIGKNKMKDWKAAVRTWVSKDKKEQEKKESEKKASTKIKSNYQNLENYEFDNEPK